MTSDREPGRELFLGVLKPTFRVVCAVTSVQCETHLIQFLLMAFLATYLSRKKPKPW